MLRGQHGARHAVELREQVRAAIAVGIAEGERHAPRLRRLRAVEAHAGRAREEGVDLGDERVERHVGVLESGVHAQQPPVGPRIVGHRRGPDGAQAHAEACETDDA
jgi:hypothetical protein